MTPEDLMRARQPERPPRDWSVIILWLSILVSVSMVTATLMWNLGRSLKIASYLKNHGVETCVGLHHPPGHKGDVDASPFQNTCKEIVEKKHDTCLDITEDFEDLRERRTEYMACLMTDGMRLAAQSEPSSATSAASSKEE
ncbi:MAG: hypothetical protein VYE40_07630 [Myxococcota bacterium]|nr:hypothetical protein [Myxococcota bacterium]